MDCPGSTDVGHFLIGHVAQGIANTQEEADLNVENESSPLINDTSLPPPPEGYPGSQSWSHLALEFADTIYRSSAYSQSGKMEHLSIRKNLHVHISKIGKNAWQE
jgi:hypothetical protein